MKTTEPVDPGATEAAHVVEAPLTTGFGVQLSVTVGVTFPEITLRVAVPLAGP